MGSLSLHVVVLFGTKFRDMLKIVSLNIETCTFIFLLRKRFPQFTKFSRFGMLYT